VLERLAGLAPCPRPTGLSAGSFRRWTTLGLYERFSEAARAGAGARFQFGALLLERSQ